MKEIGYMKQNRWISTVSNDFALLCLYMLTYGLFKYFHYILNIGSSHGKFLNSLCRHFHFAFPSFSVFFSFQSLTNPVISYSGHNNELLKYGTKFAKTSGRFSPYNVLVISKLESLPSSMLVSFEMFKFNIQCVQVHLLHSCARNSFFIHL